MNREQKTVEPIPSLRGIGRDSPIGVVGASARAAVHSLARAGYKGWGVDLFGDRDLARVAPCAVCSFDYYPTALPQLAAGFPPGPILFTGGLENHSKVVAELAATRELWGNPPEVLKLARDPFTIGRALEPRGMNLGHPWVCPADALPPDYETPPKARWLLKPRSASGGHGIRYWNAGDPLPTAPDRWYFQEFIDGISMSAVFLTDEKRTLLVGITEQLVGETWLHAPQFGYAGNIGPVSVNSTFEYILHRSGETIATATGLCGLWGFDFIFDPDIATYPVELNPRYTASVEVLEHGFGVAVFGDNVGAMRRNALNTIGKAIYYAPHGITFPTSGPWDADLTTPFDPWRLPTFADIPAANSVVPAGHPVLTLLVSGSSAAECKERLQSRARELDQLLAEHTP